jgi:hypothetical protein
MMVVYRHRTDTGCVVLLPDRWHKPPSVRTADQPGWYEFAAPDLLDCIASIMDLDEMCGERTGKNVISKNAWRFLVTLYRQAVAAPGYVRLSGKQLNWLDDLHLMASDAWRDVVGYLHRGRCSSSPGGCCGG